MTDYNEPSTEYCNANHELFYTLLGALIGLARTIDGDERNVVPDTWRMLIGGMAINPEAYSEEALREMIHQLHVEKARLAPDCACCAAPCGRNDDYDMRCLPDAENGIMTLKLRILAAARAIAIYVRKAGIEDDTLNRLMLRSLFAVGDDWEIDFLASLAEEVESSLRELMKNEK